MAGLSGRLNDGGGPGAPSSMAPSAGFQRLVRAMAGVARFDEAELGARAVTELLARARTLVESEPDQSDD